MDNYKIEFEYNGAIIQIDCQGDVTIEDIIKRFLGKANLKININDFMYLYNGEDIGGFSNNTLKTVMAKEDLERGTMKIIAFTNNNSYSTQIGNEFKLKSKYIICPKCGENCLLNIKNYKISLFGCSNGHKFDNIELDEFDDTQKVDQSKIQCSSCWTRKSEAFNNIFYKCLICSKDICPSCIGTHDNEHIIIDYDRKNNLCNMHNKENFISYCQECKLNLCFLCEDSHCGHNIIKLGKNLPQIKEIKKNLKDFETKILKIQEVIDEINGRLNKVKENLEKILTINVDLVNNFNLDNRTYQLFVNVNNIKNNINLKDVDDILNEKNIYNQCNIILKMYDQMIKKDIYFETPKYENKNGDEKEMNYKNEFFTKNGDENELNYKNEFFNKTGDENELNYKNEFFTKTGDENEIISKKELNSKSTYNQINSQNLKKKLNPKNTINIKNIIKKTNIVHNNNEITIKYNIDSNASKIRIFGEAFVKNNYNNCIFIYDNEGHSLDEFFDTEKIINKNDELVIKLKRTGEMTNLSDMFYNCESLKSLPDICNFNTSNVINMSGMFRGCKSLCEISDISKWDTSNVKDMSEMFHSCISLKKLPDISKWNINNVTNKEIMSSGSPNSLNIPHIY